MMKLFFLNVIFLIFHSLSINAQPPLNIQRYLKYINAAELKCVENNFLSAGQYYDSAFKVFPSGFAKDLYNASVCFLFLKNNEKTYEYLKPVLQKGYSILVLKEKKEFQSFFNSGIGKKLLVEYNSLNFFSYNKKLRITLDSISERDQYFRKLTGSYDKYMDSIKKIDSTNSFKLLSIIRKYGYPDEKLVGIDSTNLLWQSQDIIFIHQSKGSRTRIYDFTNILEDAINQGKIMPSKAAYYILRTSGSNEYGLSEAAVTKCVLDTTGIGQKCAYGYKEFCHLQDSMINSAAFGYENITLEDEKKFNSVRTSIGLETIQEYRKKVMYNFSNEIFSFGNVDIYVISSKQEYEARMRHITLLK